MIIECGHCNSKVDAKLLSKSSSMHPFENLPCEYLFLQCPACKDILLAYREIGQIGANEYDWGSLSRLWPPKKSPHWSLPESVRNSLIEANKCFTGQAYTACAVMCGRVLEAICAEHKIRSKFLAGGLKELLSKQIIDKRIYEWGEALRKHRNMGAHISDETITREDAANLLDFAGAICDYVFVLNTKFENFMKRQEEDKIKSKKKH
jgi:hypothetical protein